MNVGGCLQDIVELVAQLGVEHCIYTLPELTSSGMQSVQLSASDTAWASKPPPLPEKEFSQDASANPIALQPGFTQLDRWHIRHDSTGLIIHYEKRKVVDPTGPMYKKRYPDLTRALSGFCLLYEALKAESVPGNWAHLQDCGISKYVNLSTFVMCSSCFLFCSTDKGCRGFQDHLRTSGCDFKRRPIRCQGALFYGKVKQNAYYVLTNIEPAGEGLGIPEGVVDIEYAQQHALVALQQSLQQLTPEVHRSSRREMVIREKVLQSVQLAAENDVTEAESEEEEVLVNLPQSPIISHSGKAKQISPKLVATIDSTTGARAALNSGDTEHENEAIATAKRSFTTKELQKRQKVESLTNGNGHHVEGQPYQARTFKWEPVRSSDTTSTKATKTHAKTTARGTSSVTSKSTPTDYKLDNPNNGPQRRLQRVKKSSMVGQIVKEMKHDLQLYLDQMREELHDNFEDEVHKTNPEIAEIIEDYFTDPVTSTKILPFVLLDCITDDLWNASDEIADYFRFVLRGRGPELLVTSDHNKFPLSLVLSNQDGSWSACVAFQSNDDVDGAGSDLSEFTRSDKLETSGLSFHGACEILIAFRAVVYTVISRVSDGDPVPDRSHMCRFMEDCFENRRLGPEVCTKIVGEKLYQHIARWKS